MTSPSKRALLPHLLAYSVLVGIIAWLLLDRGRHPASATQDGLRSHSLSASAPVEFAASPGRPAIPHVVAELLDPRLHFEEHLELIRTLPTDLTRSELDALFGLLEDGVPPGVKPHIWSTLQNELMMALRQPRFNVADYHSRLMTLMHDRAADPIVRDYAAQHLVLHLQHSGSILPPETREQTIQSLLSVLGGQREKQQQVTGTTLMALCDLHQKQPHYLTPHLPALSEAVSVLLDLNQDVSLSNRISAIQSAGRFQFTELLPSIRQMARSETIDPNFRLSSIAALGYYHHPDDQEFLQSLAKSDTSFRHAAEAALLKFNL